MKNNSLNRINTTFDNLHHVGTNLTFLTNEICSSATTSPFPSLVHIGGFGFFDPFCCYYWHGFIEEESCGLDYSECPHICNISDSCLESGPGFGYCFPGICDGNFYDRNCSSCTENDRFGVSCDLCQCFNGICDSNVTGNGSCICDENYYGVDCSLNCDCDEETELCFDGSSGNGTCYCKEGFYCGPTLPTLTKTTSTSVSHSETTTATLPTKSSNTPYETSDVDPQYSSSEGNDILKDINGNDEDINLEEGSYNNVNLNDTTIQFSQIQVSVVTLNASYSVLLLDESVITVEGSFNIDNSFMDMNQSNLNVKGDLTIYNSEVRFTSGSTIKVSGCLIVSVGSKFVIDASEEGSIIEYECLVGDVSDINVEFVNDGDCYESRIEKNSLSVIFVCNDSDWWVILIVVVSIVLLFVIFGLIFLKYRHRNTRNMALLKDKQKKHEDKKIVMNSMQKLQTEIKEVEEQVADLEDLINHDENL
eukprot:TRINITY_DN931_c0_g1_i7.p1 TRINITY_DN931_c0_g1~~TRINITY_DN931_c0_g1_i7.p1  ORF type:complete len:478 (-),score=101.08 TRINITY_DN931_c0_g1_i7:62-1495(-)